MPDLKVINGDKSERQKQLNKERRQKQRKRKRELEDAWELEQSELERQLEQLKDENQRNHDKVRHDTYVTIAKLLVFFGGLVLALAEVCRATIWMRPARQSG
jgi:hypothetical protein